MHQNILNPRLDEDTRAQVEEDAKEDADRERWERLVVHGKKDQRAAQTGQDDQEACRECREAVLRRLSHHHAVEDEVAESQLDRVAVLVVAVVRIGKHAAGLVHPQQALGLSVTIALQVRNLAILLQLLDAATSRRESDCDFGSQQGRRGIFRYAWDRCRILQQRRPVGPAGASAGLGAFVVQQCARFRRNIDDWKVVHAGDRQRDLGQRSRLFRTIVPHSGSVVFI
mmetsp:Transcript_19584/g.55292  ORF Transcript_19584/g.55292 Transcript_19584/m.55292 type:complete len:227 (+) Transcript_19584:111-791(+)